MHLLNFSSGFVSVRGFSNYSYTVSRKQLATDRGLLNEKNLVFCLDAVSNSCLGFPDLFKSLTQLPLGVLETEICYPYKLFSRPVFVRVTVEGLAIFGGKELH